MTNPEQEHHQALLVSVYKGGAQAKAIAEEHLQELNLLAQTYGVEVLHQVICPVRQYSASLYVTEGKLEELVNLAKEYHANAIIFDDEISPSQQRNLEKTFGITVMDRTEVILGVFGQRAQTKEARLQIELAKVKYQTPRLKRLWTHLSRQHGSGGGGSGGGGHTKGEGEKQIELDRRILKHKIELLQKQIDEVRANREMQRQARQKSEIPVFGIIGYTNAGKSTLLNSLTGAGVFVEDKLFATLDTTTRKFTLPNNQEILLIDTVGFIRKLPHLLVAAFKSTLEEAFHADILLHLIDASNPMAEEQAATTFEVLQQLNVEKKPIITILNKIDQVADQECKLQYFRLKYPKAIAISALQHTGFSELMEVMITEIAKQRRTVLLRIPQSSYSLVSEVMRLGHILNQDYEENDVLIRVEIPTMMMHRVEKFIVDPSKPE